MGKNKKIQFKETLENVLSYIAIGTIVVASILVIIVVLLGLCWLCKVLLNGVLYA